jgi:hypothetical protein
MLTDIKQFELKEEHIKLLSNFNIYWVDNSYDGAPGVYPKKPYGNSNVMRDVAKIVGEDYCEDNDIEQIKRLYKWHTETEIALTVVLQAKSFEPGIYQSVNGGKYSKIEPLL